MTPPRPTRAPRGFTLLELMIVLALVAILMAIALPNYQAHVQRSHRAEARSALLQAAHWMERVATAQGVYPVATPEADVLPATLRTVPGGRYRLSLQSSTASAYTLLAEPQGAQSADPCGSFVLDQTGARHVSVAGRRGSATQASACWGR